MNIFEFAIKFERENREYYLERSRKTSNENLRLLFKELAAEEKKHEEIIIQLRSEKTVENIVSDINKTAEECFQKMAENLPETVIPTEEAHIYKEAVELEKSSKDFYLEKAKTTDLVYIKRIFQQLAHEENKHQVIMENIVELVDRPNNWLEDAEWYHLDEY